MIAFILCTLIIALTPSQSLRSFSFPIQLNLKRLAASNFSMEVTRTSPHLFRRTLELPTDSDIPFKFDILKWRSLQSSGLFANLTAQLYMANESVALSISGVELPSIFVSPQLSFSPSLSNPEFTGGVVYKNRNFRGLGEQIEVSFGHKEMVEPQVGNLPSCISLRWKDCNIGKQSRIGVGFEQDGLREHPSSMLPSSMSEHSPKLSLMTYLTRRISSTFESYLQLHDEAKGTITIEPYVSRIVPTNCDDQECLPITQSGANVAFDCIWKNGRFLRSSCDIGRLRGDGETKVRSFRWLSLETVLPLFAKVIPKVGELRGKSRWYYMNAIGDGCLPHYHLASLDSPNIMRSIEPYDQGNTLSSVLSSKMDVYLDVHPQLKLGVFNDVAIFRSHTNRPSRPSRPLRSSYGLSLRTCGLRMDVGLPLGGKLRAPRFYFGVDSD